MSRVLPILFNTDMVRAILDDRKTVTRRKIDIDISNRFDVESNGRTVVAYIDRTTGDSYNPTEICRYRPGDILYVRETWNYVYDMDGNDQIIEDTGRYIYYADDPMPFSEWIDANTGEHKEYMPWRPSIHMPKAAARIWLKVTDVRVERLQDITEEQAIKEGIARLYDDLTDAEYADWAKKTGVYPKAKAEWDYKNYLWHGNFGMHGTGNKLSDAWGYQYSSYDSAIDSFSSLWNATVPLKDWNVYGWNANPWVSVTEFERCEKPESEE